MDKQTDFQKLIYLLKQVEQDNEIVSELLNHCLETEVTYSTFNNKSEGTTKEHLLDVYEFRRKMEHDRKNNRFVFGYEKLLPILRKTTHDHICISDITSEQGSYIIFTDFGKSDFIGILKSKRKLSEIRNAYRQNKKQAEQSGDQVLYNNEENETVFNNGQLKKS